MDNTFKQPTSDNPYVGPRTFTRAQKDLYFGREREGRELLSLVVSQRLVLFYAQSGAGKSSLINTQLIPGLEERGFVVLPVGRVGGELLGGVDDTVDNIYLFNLMLSLDQSQRDPARLAHLTLPHFLERLTTEDGERWYYADKERGGQGDKVTGRQGDKEPDAYSTFPTPNSALPNYVLIIDQFEELLTTHNARWGERAEFFRQLDAAMQADPALWVVLTLREDFVAALDPYAPLLNDKLRARYYMQRMGVEAARAAIRQPAAQRQRHFLPEAVAMLINNLSQVRVAGQATTESGQSVEPVQLQVVCYQLWERLKGRLSPLITQEDIEKAGDVDRALADFYEATLAAALQSEPVARGERRLRQWVEEHLITEAGTRGTVYRGASETAGLPNAVVDSLEKSWLLRSESRAGGRWVELTHDRFVEPIRSANRAWEARQNNPLAAVTRLWLANSRDPARLLRGKPLEDAQAYAAAHAHLLTADEQALLDASVRRQAEEREAARQAAARRQSLIWAIVAVLIALTSLTTWALIKSNEADSQKHAAQNSQATALAAGTVASEQQLEAEMQKEIAVAAQGTAVAEAQNAAYARATAEANAELARRQLTRLEGLRLYQEAEQLKVQGKMSEALATYQQAAKADDSLQIDLQTQAADVRRQAAILHVRAGEGLARKGNLAEAAAQYQAALNLNPPLDTPVYVYIEAGVFIMGSTVKQIDSAYEGCHQLDSRCQHSWFELEGPQHKVGTHGLWILRTEVTNWQYAECIKAGACEKPDNTRWDKPQLRNWPVTNITWRQAISYTNWIGGRLPTEAEWEKGCRGGDNRIYPWGNEPPTSDLANVNSYVGTLTDVGSYPKGASPYGLLDMSGNAWEWTNSKYRDYPYKADDSREEPTGDDPRTLRGGAFVGSEFSVRCAQRIVNIPPYGYNYAGFRVVSPGF